MAKRTRSKSFFVDLDLKANASFESLHEGVQQTYQKMQKKRRFCGTKPLKRESEKSEFGPVKLKSVSSFDLTLLCIK